MKKRYRAASIATAVLVAILALTGCTGMGNENMDMQNQTGTPQGYDQGGQMTPDRNMLDNDVNNGDTGYGDMTGMGMDMTGMKQKARRIESELEKIPGMNDINVVISGDTAIVGCTTNQDMSAMKSRIVNRVKQLDPSVKKVAVTNARDTLMEIRKLKSDMMGGSDTGGINARVKQLVNKITPNQ